MSIKDIFGKELNIINVGLRGFAEDLQQQGKRVVQVDWRPPAGGDKNLQSILERMKKKG